MELEQWLRTLQSGIQAPGSDDGAAVEGRVRGADRLTEAERQRDKGRCWTWNGLLKLQSSPQ